MYADSVHFYVGANVNSVYNWLHHHYISVLLLDLYRLRWANKEGSQVCSHPANAISPSNTGRRPLSTQSEGSWPGFVTSLRLHWSTTLLCGFIGSSTASPSTVPYAVHRLQIYEYLTLDMALTCTCLLASSYARFSPALLRAFRTVSSSRSTALLSETSKEQSARPI